jgi:hypothetical protein
MPLKIHPGFPSLLIRRSAFERAGLTRAAFDAALSLTSDEFQVEGDLIMISPILVSEALQDVIATLETAGLAHFDDFFDFSGHWPDWLDLFAMARAVSR